MQEFLDQSNIPQIPIRDSLIITDNRASLDLRVLLFNNLIIKIIFIFSAIDGQLRYYVMLRLEI